MAEGGAMDILTDTETVVSVSSSPEANQSPPTSQSESKMDAFDQVLERLRR